DLLAHGARVADDAPRPIEHALAFRREALEARAALHEEYAELILELFDAGREGRLAHAAGFRRVAEMPLARECDDEFELFQHGLLSQERGERAIGVIITPTPPLASPGPKAAQGCPS